MGVAGQDQAHSIAGRERDYPWIVREQNRGSVARNSAHGTPNVSAIPIIVYAGNVEGGAAKLYRSMLIPKDFYAFSPQCGSHGISAYPEIVVAQDS